MIETRIEQSLETWNSIAESFHQTRKQTWDFCIDYISSINKDACCADLGCGNGRHLLPLTLRCNKTIGFDISNKLLQITAKRLKENKITNCYLVQGDLCTLPFQSQSIDHLIYIAALHNIKHRKNRIQSLKEVYRILKSNGTALVSVWSQDQERFHHINWSDQDNSESGDITLYWRQHSLNVPRFYHLYQKDEFKQDLMKAHFSIISFQEISLVSKKTNDNYYAILQKKG